MKAPDTCFNGGVRLHSDAQVLSFLMFIFPRLGDDMAETVARMRSIEYMNINLFPPPSEIAARALRLFFQFASTGGTILNFTRLHIHRAEVLLSTDEEMKDAIGRLQTIQELVITGAGERTFTLLCGLQSSLTNARIAADADASRNIPLRGQGCTTIPQSPDETVRDTQSLLFHCMLTRRAELLRCPDAARGIESPVTGHYTSAFPFLSLLRVEDCSVSYCRDGRGDRYTSGREHPIADSARLMALFNLLNGPLFDIYILGLTCHVPDLDLRQARNELNRDMLHAVIADTRPVNLAYSTDNAEFFLGGDFVAFAD